MPAMDLALIQSLGRDREVDDAHLGERLGGVVRVRHRRGHEELELRVILDLLVSNADHQVSPLLLEFIQQDGLQTGVQFLADVLDHLGVPEQVEQEVLEVHGF